MAKKLTILLIYLLIAFFTNNVKASTFVIDKTAVVLKVIDGDTFDIESGERIRLADIDTSEEDEAGFSSAKSYVASLVEGKTVYLDIDDISRTDQYDRLVSVVYFDYNSTHYENLNKVLLVEGYAVIDNFTNNEFNPSNWDLYEPKAVIPEFPALATITILLMAFSLSTFLLKRKAWKILPLDEK